MSPRLHYTYNTRSAHTSSHEIFSTGHSVTYFDQTAFAHTSCQSNNSDNEIFVSFCGFQRSVIDFQTLVKNRFLISFKLLFVKLVQN